MADGRARHRLFSFSSASGSTRSGATASAKLPRFIQPVRITGISVRAICSRMAFSAANIFCVERFGMGRPSSAIPFEHSLLAPCFADKRFDAAAVVFCPGCFWEIGLQRRNRDVFRCKRCGRFRHRESDPVRQPLPLAYLQHADRVLLHQKDGRGLRRSKVYPHAPG